MKNCIVKEELRHGQRKEVPFEEKTLRRGINALLGVKHQIYDLRVHKMTLGSPLLKRWIADNGIDIRWNMVTNLLAAAECRENPQAAKLRFVNGPLLWPIYQEI